MCHTFFYLLAKYIFMLNKNWVSIPKEDERRIILTILTRPEIINASIALCFNSIAGKASKDTMPFQYNEFVRSITAHRSLYISYKKEYSAGIHDKLGQFRNNAFLKNT